MKHHPIFVPFTAALPALELHSGLCFCLLFVNRCVFCLDTCADGLALKFCTSSVTTDMSNMIAAAAATFLPPAPLPRGTALPRVTYGALLIWDMFHPSPR
eukprot:529859-Amphidinium_carterae.1